MCKGREVFLISPPIVLHCLLCLAMLGNVGLPARHKFLYHQDPPRWRVFLDPYGGSSSQSPVETQIVEYAQKIGMDCAYLELADAYLLSVLSDKALAVILHNVEEHQIMSVEQFAKKQGLTRHPFPQQSISIDRTSSSTWCLVACNGSYQVDSGYNHWVPGFFREQIGEKAFWYLTVLAFAEASKQIRDLKRAVHGLESQMSDFLAGRELEVLDEEEKENYGQLASRHVKARTEVEKFLVSKRYKVFNMFS